MAFQLALGCRTVGYTQQRRKCCCDNNCARCNDGTAMVCPKSLRVQLNTFGCSYDFNVNCFQTINNTFPTATVREDLINTLTEQKYTEITVSVEIFLGSAFIVLGHTQYWQYPGSPVMQQFTRLRVRTTVAGGVLTNCLYPSWSHFPCSIDSTNLVCGGVGNSNFSPVGTSWRFWSDIGTWPQPPICDFGEAGAPGFWNATLSWV